MFRTSSLMLLSLAWVAGCDADVDSQAPSDAFPAEQLAPPQDFTLTVSPLVVGSTATMSIQGARPNGAVFLFRAASTVPGGWCPPIISPDCLDMPPNAINQLQFNTDAAGNASVSFTFPSVPIPGVGLQAAYLAGGVFSSSNPIDRVVHQPGSDLDGDGLTAADEVNTFLTNPDVADSDGGGVDDGAEIAAGTDPLDPSDDNVGGGVVDIDSVAPGGLVITEFIANPDAVSDGDGEWFEIFNASSDDIDLEGMIIGDDGTNNHSVGASVIVPAGGYALLGINGNVALNGGLALDYDYSGFTLANNDDEIVLENANGEIDRVAYGVGAFQPVRAGHSTSLDPSSTDAVANDDGANWCDNVPMTFITGDFGTPGMPNPPCPPPPPTWDADIYPILLATCDGCHVNGAVSGGLNLDAYTSIFAIDPETGLQYIESGDVAASYLFLKLTGDQATVVGGDGVQMPQGLPALPPAEIDLFRAWIEAGAPEN